MGGMGGMGGMAATDTGAAPDLTTFANDFPLYFRAPLLLALCWLLWGINIFVFNRTPIDVAEVLNFNRATMLSPASILRSALGILCAILALLLLYSVRWPVDDAMMYPTVLYVLGTLALFAPFDVLHRNGRERLLSNLARVAMPPATGVLFVEVLVGDILTSLCKVLADMEVTACILITHMTADDRVAHEHAASHMVSLHVASTSSAMHSPAPEAAAGSLALFGNEHGCADSWMRPFVTSIPFLLRFRQCWASYRATGLAFPHLMNCLKYLSSLPVIWISAYTHAYPGYFSSELRLAWITAVSFNSFFAFMWDVVMDWGLCRQGSKYFLLRERLLYSSASFGGVSSSAGTLDGAGSQDGGGAGGAKSDGAGSGTLFEDASGASATASWLSVPVVYYLAIVVDFVLRILWSFKLSVHFQLSQEGVTFVLEVCELFRRFLWIFFRVEWEAIDKGLLHGSAGGMSVSLGPAKKSEDADGQPPASLELAGLHPATTSAPGADSSEAGGGVSASKKVRLCCVLYLALAQSESPRVDIHH